LDVLVGHDRVAILWNDARDQHHVLPASQRRPGGEEKTRAVVSEKPGSRKATSKRWQIAAAHNGALLEGNRGGSNGES
jgi:hypothetical protein